MMAENVTKFDVGIGQIPRVHHGEGRRAKTYYPTERYFTSTKSVAEVNKMVDTLLAQVSKAYDHVWWSDRGPTQKEQRLTEEQLALKAEGKDVGKPQGLFAFRIVSIMARLGDDFFDIEPPKTSYTATLIDGR